MDQLINDYVTYLKDMKHASPNTIGAYRNDLIKLKNFLENQGITEPNKISGTSLNSYILLLEKDGMAPASVSRNIASIKVFIFYLLKIGKINNDPSEFIRPPKVIKKYPNLINVDHINLLLMQPDTGTNKGIRDKAMLELLYASGMKVTELISLKITDINLNGRYLICGEKKERIIPFGNAAKNALQEYLSLREETWKKKSSQILFLNSSGEQFSRQGFWKLFKGYAKMAGFEDANPNTVRHSFAAHLIENGADLASVQEFLGHTDISTTQLYLPHTYKNSREVYMNSHPRA